jgi:hypothetical protein
MDTSVLKALQFFKMFATISWLMRQTLGPTQPPVPRVVGHFTEFIGRGVEMTTCPHQMLRIRKE